MMCEEETGIEIRNGDGKGWRDVAYLNGEDLGPMTDAQWLYMRQQQIMWGADRVDPDEVREDDAGRRRGKALLERSTR